MGGKREHLSEGVAEAGKRLLEGALQKEGQIGGGS